jgi:hypothetical protein
MFDIEVIGVKFISRNQYGDFFWMCQQNKYSNSLYIFNDNEEYHDTDRRGAGNALMRSFNRHSNYEIPFSAGIPTGTLGEGKYQKFTPEIKKVIDDSIDEIIELIRIYKYKTIYFSAELDGKLGTSIFAVNPKVINYITNRIYGLTKNPVKIIKLLSNNNFEEDFEFDIDSKLKTD